MASEKWVRPDPRRLTRDPQNYSARVPKTQGQARSALLQLPKLLQDPLPGLPEDTPGASLHALSAFYEFFQVEATSSLDVIGRGKVTFMRLICYIAALTALAHVSDGMRSSFAIEEDRFTLDGKAIQLISGR